MVIQPQTSHGSCAVCEPDNLGMQKKVAEFVLFTSLFRSTFGTIIEKDATLLNSKS